jgi:hypothetical protein
MQNLHEARPVQVFSVGAHLVPADGACLMEAVSQAAGEPWSDTPACTHPLLSHLARLVNDASSDQGRQELVRGHEKVPTGGQVEVPTGGQIEVPTLRVVS